MWAPCKLCEPDSSVTCQKLVCETFIITSTTTTIIKILFPYTHNFSYKLYLFNDVNTAEFSAVDKMDTVDFNHLNEWGGPKTYHFDTNFRCKTIYFLSI